MKKILCMMLVFIMVTSMTVTAFATTVQAKKILSVDDLKEQLNQYNCLNDISENQREQLMSRTAH